MRPPDASTGPVTDVLAAIRVSVPVVLTLPPAPAVDARAQDLAEFVDTSFSAVEQAATSESGAVAEVVIIPAPTPDDAITELLRPLALATLHAAINVWSRDASPLTDAATTVFG